TLFIEEASSSLNVTLTGQLQKMLNKINLSNSSVEERRKAVQLALLKGMKNNTQQQHVLTPESVALFIGYLANKLLSGKESVRVFDPASGTGNLLLTVMEQLEQVPVAYASEVDPTLIQLSVMNANLQEKKVEFFHQDSLRPF